MDSKMLKAIIYSRVSTDEQKDNTSLDEQHAVCKAKAAAMGAQVVGYYEDPGVSGGFYFARPGIQAAIADLENGKANVLIIAKLDRCSRDREHQSAIKKRVKSAGAELVFCDMEFADTPEGDLQFGILGSFAEYERKIIRERTTKGARRAAMQGIQTKTAMRPYGYYIPSKQDVFLGKYSAADFGKYQVVEEEAVVVREMFEWVAGGQSLHGLARWLEERGVPTPRQGKYWRCSTLKRILDNPVYKGKAPYGRHERITDESRLQRGFTTPCIIRERPEEEWIYIACPALVSEGVWEKCQQLLRENKSRHGGRPDRKYTLTGLLRCPKCQRKMQATKRMQASCPSRIANGSYKPQLRYVYSCRDSRPSRNTGGHQCNPRNYNGSKAERCVFEAVKHAAQQPQATAAALKAHYDTMRGDSCPHEYERLKKQLEELEKRERATVEAQIRGLAVGTNVSIFEDLLRGIAKQRTDLTHQLEEASRQRVSVTDSDCNDTAQIIAEALQTVEAVFNAPQEEITDNEKRELLARVVESVYPTEDFDAYAVTLKPLTQDALTVACISRL